MTRRRDVLKHYLGCEVSKFGFTESDGSLILTQIDSGGSCELSLFDKEGRCYGDMWYQVKTDEIKPILRRISSLTEEEKIELVKLHWGENLDVVLPGHSIKVETKSQKTGAFMYAIYRDDGSQETYATQSGVSFNPLQFQKLCEWGIDLFSLIDNGFAEERR